MRKIRTATAVAAGFILVALAQRIGLANVAAQLRNRTMPPVETKLTEDDRLRVATWIENRLRQTACAVGDFAGAVTLPLFAGMTDAQVDRVGHRGG